MVFSINPSVNKTQEMFAQMAVQQNGTGVASPITGGSAPPPPPPASGSSSTAAAPPSQNTGSMVSGTGSMENGACSCSCQCGAGSFPNAAVQGQGMIGGIPGMFAFAISIV